MEAREVVERLQQEPFNYKELTLSTFGDKKGEDLVKLVGDVFAILCPQHAKDAKRETIDRTTERVLDFLRMCDYKHGMDSAKFEQAVREGQPEVLHPVLKWAIVDPEKMKRHAFIAYYLSEVEIPGENFQDEEIFELNQTMRTLMTEFAQVHKDLEHWRKAHRSAEGLKERIKNLEEERDQLKKRIKATDDKVKSVVADDIRSKLAEQAHNFRSEQDKEYDLHSQYNKEMEKYNSAREKVERLRERESELHSMAAETETSAYSLIQQLEEEARNNRRLANEELPKQLQNLRDRIDTLYSLPKFARSEADIGKLREELNQLEKETGELEEQVKARKEKAGDDHQLQQQRNTARNVARKKQEKQARLAKMQERRRKLVGQDDAPQQESAPPQEEKEPMSEEEKKRVVDVAKRYKQLKVQMDEVNSELLTLTHTEEQLSLDAERAQEALQAAEGKAGVTGAAETQSKLESMSQQKASADEVKEQALKDISGMVEEMRKKINSRKAELKPKAEELKQEREKFKQMESQHAELEREYNAHKSSYEQRRAKLASRVKSIRRELREAEQQYHAINIRDGILGAQRERVASDRGRPEALQALNDRIEEDEQEQADLRSKDAYVSENLGNFTSQRQMLFDLKKLLEARLHALSSMGETFHYGSSDVLAL